ncbi:MAG: glycosyltransferase family 2 protein [Anaerolineaceae bacterium]|nr:glycosyltransferase family 2 protein [Anaerolineaceae bacterium]
MVNFMEKPLLSIVIPAHNEEHRLPQTLEKISSFLAAQPYQAEVVVVENGSSDATLEIAQQYEVKHGNIRVINLIDSGKGLAVREGMLAATGEYRFICDADLSMPIEEVNKFIPPQLENFDVAIASREAAGAKRYNEPAYRHFIGRIFNALVRVVALPSLHDTQCGFKCFHAPVAEKVFRLQTFTGWSFDVEVLYVALMHGYKVLEIPINWYHIPGSRVKLFQDSFRMAADILTIRRNAKNGLYD